VNSIESYKTECVKSNTEL